MTWLGVRSPCRRYRRTHGAFSSVRLAAQTSWRALRYDFRENILTISSLNLMKETEFSKRCGRKNSINRTMPKLKLIDLGVETERSDTKATDSTLVIPSLSRGSNGVLLEPISLALDEAGRVLLVMNVLTEPRNGWNMEKGRSWSG
jgi:hypothetical protein